MNSQQTWCLLLLFFSNCILVQGIICNVCDYYDDCRVNTETNASACWTATATCTAASGSASYSYLTGGWTEGCGETMWAPYTLQGVTYTCQTIITCCYTNNCNVCPNGKCGNHNFELNNSIVVCITPILLLLGVITCYFNFL